MCRGILIFTCCPWGNLKGKAAGGCDLEKQDRLWSEPFGAGYNAGGECEAVFSVREGCEAVFSVHEKRWCKRVGYEYWHIWLHMTRWYI